MEVIEVFKYRRELDKCKHNILVREESYECAFQTNKDDVAKFMNRNFRLNRMAEEYAYMIAYDIKMRPLGVFEISHGTVNCSIINPRDILISALLCGASGFILIHNHPSGDCSPSADDHKVTKRVKDAGQLVGIPLIDHIIVGEGIFSFQLSGLL